VATQIVTRAVSADVSVSDLAKLAIGDAGFAARVIALANSAAYGLANRVSEIRQACMLLGVRGLRNVALSLVVSDMVPPGEDADLLLVTALRRAVAARLVAEALDDRALDDAFTAGLFLEIGTLLRARTDLAGAASVARMPASHRPAEPTGPPVSLMILDVDHFKKVNDAYGHQAGDLVLANVAEVLRSCLRLGDVPARYGGEEFLVLLPGTDTTDAMRIAEHIRAAVERTEVQCPTGVLRITASLGVASVQGRGHTPSALFERADAAMYLAKNTGRNRVIAAK
jgi:diguanylate cyclase (GGDEF)-like protein